MRIANLRQFSTRAVIGTVGSMLRIVSLTSFSVCTRSAQTLPIEVPS